jgi:hypothetical protein
VEPVVGGLIQSAVEDVTLTQLTGIYLLNSLGTFQPVWSCLQQPCALNESPVQVSAGIGIRVDDFVFQIVLPHKRVFPN